MAGARHATCIISFAAAVAPNVQPKTFSRTQGSFRSLISCVLPLIWSGKEKAIVSGLPAASRSEPLGGSDHSPFRPRWQRTDRYSARSPFLHTRRQSPRVPSPRSTTSALQNPATMQSGRLSSVPARRGGGMATDRRRWSLEQARIRWMAY